MKTTIHRSNRPVSTSLRKTGRRATATEVIDLIPSLIQFKSIVVPIDFSAVSRKGLSYAARIAEQFGGKLILIHVVEPVATPEFAAVSLLVENDAARKNARDRLEGLLREMTISPKLVEKIVVRFGAPFAEISAAAKSLKADLIVVTTHGYTGLKHVLMGSTAERIVRHAPCPVLTVREKGR